MKIELHGLAMHTVQIIKSARGVGLVLFFAAFPRLTVNYDPFLTLAAS